MKNTISKKMNFKIRQYRPGHYQVYFSHQGKQIFLQKGLNDGPIRSEGDAYLMVAYLQSHGYHPQEWGKDKSYHFNVAIQNWVKLSQISPEWLQERTRLVEKVFIPFFGKQDIREIKTIKIDEFQRNLKDKGLSSKYIKNVLGELKTFFRFNKKSLPELPEFRKIEVQDPPIRWLSEDAQDKVFQFIPKKHIPIFTFLKFYGCRLNEACGLQRKNIFQEHQPSYIVISSVIGKNGQLKPITKTKRIKVLPIIPETEWLFKPTEVTPLLFSHSGKPYTSKKLNRIWESANKKANIEYGVPILNVYNSLRHSFACQRLNQGFSLDKVSTVLGHTSTQMTKRYAQYTVDKLGDVIRGKREPVHSLFMAPKISKLLDLQPKMVGGTGIEPATSGL
jgi:integrase